MRNYHKIVIALLIFCNVAIINHASGQGLNNGLLRAGNGTENSINSLGILKQPFYYSDSLSQWFKLTFGDSPLDYAIRVGGDGTSEWNLNGTYVENPVLTGLVIDAAGFTLTGTYTGYGTVISSGTIDVAGQSFLIEQFYTLPQNRSFIQIKTKVTNTSATIAPNVRLWVGTRDDWVGNTDSPTKVKGNFVSGSFAQISSSAEQSKAMQIVSGQEAVLVYSPSPKGYMINGLCCSFTNVTDKDPLTEGPLNYGDPRIPTNGPIWTGDGSYAFFARMNDLNPSQSDEFTWYYGAGSLASITDIINQVGSASATIQNINCTGATYNATSTTAGTGYYIVVADGATAPTAQQIKDGVTYSSVNIVASGSGPIPANVATAYNILGLSAATAYKIYFVSQDAALVFTTIANASFSTTSAPVATASSSTPTICAGNTISLAGGGVGTYAWTSSSGFTSTEQSPTITNATVAASGVYTITVTNVSGCTSTATTAVTVNALPTATASSNSPICAGTSLNLTGGGIGTYAWSGPNSYASTAQSPTIANATAAASGVYTLTLTNANGCTSTITTSVTVNANPTATASSNSPICAGKSLNLTGGQGAGYVENGTRTPNSDTYAWSGPNGYASTAQSPTIANATTASSGVYTLTVTNANGCTSTVTTSVMVNAVPSATASSNSPICAGTSLNLTGGGIGTYAWSGPNSYASTAQSPTIANATAAASGVYTLTLTNANGCTSTITTSVTVNANPTATASSNSPICAGTSLNLTGGGTVVFLNSIGGGQDTYAWSGPNGYASTAQNPTISSAKVEAAGVYTLTLTNANGCTSTVTTSVNVNATPTASASSNSPICAGTSLNLNGGGPVVDLNSIHEGQDTYAWSGPNGFASTAKSPTIANAKVEASGVYTLTVTNANKCTTTVTTSVTVNALPAATASSNSPICAGTSLNLNGGLGDSFVPNACLNCDTYAWTGPNGFASTAQNPTIPSAKVEAAGVYTLTVTNGNKCTSTVTTSVTVNPVVVIPTPQANTQIILGNSINLTATGCSGLDDVLKWYQASDNQALDNSSVNMPVSPKSTTNYYAKCETTLNGITCVSANSNEVTVTVISRVYVDIANVAAPTQDGNSWATAFGSLQAGLDAATPGRDVWVAKGTYKTTTTKTRTIYFNMPNNIAVYGGFAGTENNLSQRDLNTNVSILSGDIGTQDLIDDNSYHVVTFAGSSNTTILDGFTISGGNASFDPKTNASPSVTAPAPDSPTIETGGGILVLNAGKPTIAHCKIINNKAIFGGGIFCIDESAFILNESNISNNESTFGSAIYARNASHFTMNSVLIVANKGLGCVYNNGSNPTLNNCTIASNGGYNGAIFNYQSQPTVKNSILWGNAEPALNDTQSIITYSLLQGEYVGVGNLNVNPKFVNPAPYQPAPNTTGDYHLQVSSLAIDRGENGTISLSDKDLAGNLRRFLGGKVDMGAYEFQGVATATLIISAVTGPWEANSTWDLGRVPKLGDYVIINNNHVVTLNTPGVAKNLEYRGTGILKFNTTTSKLELGF